MKTLIIYDFIDGSTRRDEIQYPDSPATVESIRFAHMAGFFQYVPVGGPAKLCVKVPPNTIPELELMGCLVELIERYQRGDWHTSINADEAVREVGIDRVMRYLFARYVGLLEMRS